MITRIWLLTVALVPLACAGCGMLAQDWQQKLPWSSKSKLVESGYQRPMRMAAIWTPDVLTQPGKPAVRGFGGRLYFYNQKSQAIPVEGQLVVYAYDDSNEVDNRQTPDRKYAFTPEQFSGHYSESDLGASYSIWLPWDRLGGERASVSLVPVFTSADGQIVMGQQAINLLPGKKPAQPAEAEADQSPQLTRTVQPAGFHDVAGDQPTPTSSRQLKTTTIMVPPSLRERMKQASAAAILQSARAAPRGPIAPQRIPGTSGVDTTLAAGQFAARSGRLAPSSQPGSAPIWTSGSQPSAAQVPAGPTTHFPAQRRHPQARAQANPGPERSSTRFAPRTPPAPGGPADRSDRAAALSPPHPARSPFGHPFSRQPAPSAPARAF